MSKKAQAVSTDGSSIQLGEDFSVSFLRTLRIPDDGKTYPLPPGLGRFPIRVIDPSNERIPAPMRKRGGFIIPMYQCEALWMSFRGALRAVQVGVGGINAVSGRRWSGRMTARPQNYLVAPDQPWLDGINAGNGFIRQFVAMPLGQGYTVEEQITGKARFGGIQLRAVHPKRMPPRPAFRMMIGCAMSADAMMGLGAGGRMKQQIDKDSYGIDFWNQKREAKAFIHIVNTEQWTAITGEAAPPTPIDAAVYTAYGLPWFDLYREDTPAVDAPGILKKVKSVKEIDKKKGRKEKPGNKTVKISGKQVITLDGGDWPK